MIVTDTPAVRILGSRVHLISAQETVDQIEHWVNDHDLNCHRVVVTGFHGLLEADRNPRLRSILNEADLWTPDGIAPVWVARLNGFHNVQRATGTDIMQEFFRRANERGYGSFFYGDTDATLGALRTRLNQDYPGHHVAGVYSPPFRPMTKAEDDAIIDRINRARPDVLWVGLGMPKQDVWIYERMHRLNVPVAIGVGAAFAFIAGTVRRCPEWIGRTGFEWAYRLLREPKKLWRRDLIDGPKFLFRLAKDLAGAHHRRTVAFPKV
jgi:N-acetylglucosaminyldiphosphoundecaprenol N-acetyl-beta-D-mannosaminyltransferase